MVDRPPDSERSRMTRSYHLRNITKIRSDSGISKGEPFQQQLEKFRLADPAESVISAKIKLGNSTVMWKLSLAERFWRSVEKTNSCWIWNGRFVTSGYGVLTVCRRGRLTHRLSWLFHNGDIPEGMFVLHHCDNPPCCNPAHLFLGTKGDNARDCAAKSRQHMQRHPESRYGEGNPAAKLTSESAAFIRSNYSRGIVTLRMLAEKYGVSLNTVRRVVVGISHY